MSKELLDRCENVMREIRISLICTSLVQILFIIIIRLVAYMQPDCDERIIYVAFSLCYVLAFSVLYNVCIIIMYSAMKPYRNQQIFMFVNQIYYSSSESAHKIMGVPKDGNNAKGVYWVYGPYGGKHFVEWR